MKGAGSALLASALGGALYFLGYLGFGFWPLLAVFVCPLWWAIERSRGAAHAGLCGFVFGGVAFVGGHDWLLALVDVFLAGDPWLGGGLFSAYGVWFALGFAIYAAVVRALRGRGAGFAGAAIPAWLVLEWLYPTLFPVYAGAGWIDAWPLVQIADLGGPLLLSLEVLLVNAALFGWMQEASDDDASQPAVVGAAALMLATSLGYGAWQWHADGSRDDVASLNVGLVQANLGLLEKRELAAAGHREHLALSRALLAEHTELDLLVWPETAYARAIPGPLPVSGALVLQGLDTPLLFGAPMLDPSTGSRVQFNAAFLAGRDGVIGSAYRKNLLIPLAEAIPLQAWLPDWSEALPHAQSFAASGDMNSLQLGAVRIATPICYEAILPSFVRRLVVEGDANLIVTLANDAWFGDSREPRLHLQLARLRAIELRRHVVRATNSGISAFIDPLGRITAATGLLERATLSGEVRPLEGTTLYARMGDWPGIAAVLWLISVTFTARRPGTDRGSLAAG